MQFYFGLSLRLQRQQQHAQLLMMLLPVCLVGEKKVLPKRVVGVWVHACVYNYLQQKYLSILAARSEPSYEKYTFVTRGRHEVCADQPAWLRLRAGTETATETGHSMRPTDSQEMHAGRMRCMYLFSSSSFSASFFFCNFYGPVRYFDGCTLNEPVPRALSPVSTPRSLCVPS